MIDQWFEGFKSISKKELTTSGDSLGHVLTWYEKEGGISVCNRVHSDTVISVFTELVQLASGELQWCKLISDDSICRPDQHQVSVFCGRFLIDLFRACDYEDLFNSLQKISASLPSIDYYDDIGLSDLDAMSIYKKAFLLEAVSILQAQLTRLKEQMLQTDLEPCDITNDLNLFSAAELICRIDRKLQTMELEKHLQFVRRVNKALLKYLDLFEQTKDRIFGHVVVSTRSLEAQRYWFDVTGHRFIKTVRDNKDLMTVVSWLDEKAAAISARHIIEEQKAPMIQLVHNRHLEAIRACFSDLVEKRIVIHENIEGLIKSRFYVGTFPPKSLRGTSGNYANRSYEYHKDDACVVVKQKTESDIPVRFIRGVNKVKVKANKRTDSLQKYFIPKNHRGSFVVKPIDVIKGLFEVIRNYPQHNFNLKNVFESSSTSDYHVNLTVIQIFIVDLFSKVKESGFSEDHVRRVRRTLKS